MDYGTQEASFAIPAGYADGTLNRLVYKRAGGDLLIVVGRTPAQGKSLEEVVTVRLRDQQRSIPYLEVGERSPRQVDLQTAVDVRLTFVEKQQKKYQRSVSIAVDKNVVVVAVLGPLDSRDEIDGVFDTAVASMTFRKKD